MTAATRSDCKEITQLRPSVPDLFSCLGTSYGIHSIIL